MGKIVLAFDFDGVIVDTARESFLSSAKSYNEMTGKNVINSHNEKQYVKGRAFSLNAESNYTLIKIIAENTKIDFENYTQKEFDKEKNKNIEQAKIFVPLFHKHRAQDRETIEWLKSQPVFPGIKNAIKALSKKYPLYITTTKKLDSVIPLLEYHKIEMAKDHLISGSTLETKEKLLQIVAQRENTDISNVILFDDAIKQLISAKQIGAKVVLVLWGEKRQVFINEANKLRISLVYGPSECKAIIENFTN